jgi:hypothetical protein
MLRTKVLQARMGYHLSRAGGEQIDHLNNIPRRYIKFKLQLATYKKSAGEQ